MTDYTKSKGVLGNAKAAAAKQAAPLSDEEKKQQLIRAAAQKFNSLVEGIVFNAVQGAGADLTREAADQIFDNAKHIAERYLDELMGVKLTKKEEAK